LIDRMTASRRNGARIQSLKVCLIHNHGQHQSCSGSAQTQADARQVANPPIIPDATTKDPKGMESKVSPERLRTIPL